jgi:hypothetical protein
LPRGGLGGGQDDLFVEEGTRTATTPRQRTPDLRGWSVASERGSVGVGDGNGARGADGGGGGGGQGGNWIGGLRGGKGWWRL